MRTLHVVPRGDVVEHDTATEEASCLCGPSIERVSDGGPDGWVIVHHSLDGRETVTAGDAAREAGPATGGAS